MRSGIGKFLVSAIFLGLAVGTSTRPAAAADLGLMTSGPIGGFSGIFFICENGPQNPLFPIALSVSGEGVTASPFTRRPAGHVWRIPLWAAALHPCLRIC